MSVVSYVCIHCTVFLCTALQISNLFARDEMDEITQQLIPVMKKHFPRRPPTPENLQEYFMCRTRQNLHIVLCFSPVSIDILYFYFRVLTICTFGIMNLYFCSLDNFLLVEIYATSLVENTPGQNCELVKDIYLYKTILVRL